MQPAHSLTLLLLGLLPLFPAGRAEKPDKQPGCVEIEVRIISAEPGKCRKRILADPKLHILFGRGAAVELGGCVVPMPSGLRQVGVLFEELGLRIDLLATEATGGRVRVNAEVHCRELHPTSPHKAQKACVSAIKVVRYGDAFTLKVPVVNGMSHLVEVRVLKHVPLSR